ncbi:4Fe-4S dicluster domain-containing protein [Desulfosporosinus fructosivorans]
MKDSGFQIEHCRSNCPKSARNWQNLNELLTKNLTALNLHQSLADKFSPVLHHHIPKICLAGCPNGCSHPNIKDFGISGYVTPRITDVPCIGCNECVRSCLEKAISWNPSGIVIDPARCLSCGDCQHVCPSGTLTEGETGWTLRSGGRVGRHPRFAKPAGQVQTDEEVLTWISDTIHRYIENGKTQERLTHFLERE